jgi:hypothetical protein
MILENDLYKRLYFEPSLQTRLLEGVGDWESSLVKSGPAYGPFVCALSAARPRSGRLPNTVGAVCTPLANFYFVASHL